MNADCYFSIGRSHKICQDYALAGIKNQLPYVIISDGCSSSKNTDFGSRILSKCTERFVYDPLQDQYEYTDYILGGAYIRGQAMIKEYPELPPECLDASLLMARIQNKHSVQVIVTGDGVIAAKKKNGAIVVKTISYKDNAPVYLSYRYDEARRKKLFETYDCTKTIATTVLQVGHIDETTEEISTEETEIFYFPVEEYSFISIMTDGISSFQKTVQTNTSRTLEDVFDVDIIPDLMSYKGDAGEFVQRRTNKLLKTLGEQGIHHNDDFSIGTISL